MSYTIQSAKSVEKILRKWKKSNPALFEKVRKLYKDISEHPREGLGHPEPLVGGNDITWSRHITAHDRMIYDIYDLTVHVNVLEIEGHYRDK